MKWPWGKKPETRESSYTDAFTRALLSAASGTASSTAAGTGALESAAGWWARGLATASLAPEDRRLVCVTPEVLADIGRRLCRYGESLHLIDVAGGMPRLIPAWSWDVQGSPDPETWRYLVTLAGPSTTESRTVRAESVLHVRYATDPGRPWRGVSPLGWAAVTGALAGAVEASLRDESGGPVGSIMPVPEGQTPGADEAGANPEVDPLAPLTAAIRAAAGRILVMETTAGGYGDKAGAPGRDWKAERFGPAPPDSMPTIRDCVERSIYAATGIPGPLVSDRGDGTAGREALRRLVATTLQPLGRIIAAELRAKLHPGAELSFGSIAAADITGRARAWRTLIGREGTMPVDRASELTGLS